MCETAARAEHSQKSTNALGWEITIVLSCCLYNEAIMTLKFLSLTVSFTLAGVAWFTLITKEGWRQQQFLGYCCLFSCRFPDKHDLHIRVLVHTFAGQSRRSHCDTADG